ncbi:MAG: lysophospholipid acyltransferase family protein [bacterium]
MGIKIRDSLAEIVLYISYYLISHILPLHLQYRVAKWVGSFLFFVIPTRRKIGISKMSRVLKKEKAEVKKCVKKMVQNYCYRIVELFLLPKLNWDNVNNFIEYEGLEYLDQVLSQGKGGIMATPHLGNCELGCAGLLIKGYPVIPIAWNIPVKGIDRLFKQIKQKIGMMSIHPDQAGMRKVLSALEDNKLVGIVSDVDGGPTGIPVEFFGRKKSFPIGPIKLALLTKAALIPIYCFRTRPGNLKVMIEEPMILEKGHTPKEELFINTQRLAQKIESYISKYPEQWLWLPLEEAEEEIGKITLMSLSVSIFFNMYYS